MSKKTVKVKVLLDSIEKVKSFVRTTSQFEADLDLISGKYVIDAKSILGLFSLNLSEALVLKIEGSEHEVEEILEALKPYIVE